MPRVRAYKGGVQQSAARAAAARNEAARLHRTARSSGNSDARALQAPTCRDFSLPSRHAMLALRRAANSRQAAAWRSARKEMRTMPRHITLSPCRQHAACVLRCRWQRWHAVDSALLPLRATPFSVAADDARVAAGTADAAIATRSLAIRRRRRRLSTPARGFRHFAISLFSFSPLFRCFSPPFRRRFRHAAAIAAAILMPLMRQRCCHATCLRFAAIAFDSMPPIFAFIFLRRFFDAFVFISFHDYFRFATPPCSTMLRRDAAIFIRHYFTILLCRAMLLMLKRRRAARAATSDGPLARCSPAPKRLRQRRPCIELRRCHAMFSPLCLITMPGAYAVAIAIRAGGFQFFAHHMQPRDCRRAQSDERTPDNADAMMPARPRRTVIRPTPVRSPLVSRRRRRAMPRAATTPG